jgi:hypothetical protein
MYCVMKCVETKRVLKRRFASFIFHSCNAKTQICVTRPQCVNISGSKLEASWTLGEEPLEPIGQETRL